MGSRHPAGAVRDEGRRHGERAHPHDPDRKAIGCSIDFVRSSTSLQ